MQDSTNDIDSTPLMQTPFTLSQNIAEFSGLIQMQNPHFYFDDDFGRKIFEVYLEVLIEPMKALWRDKIVIVLEGFNSYFGVYNDLFKGTRRVIRLNGYPSFNAFSKIDNIIADALNTAKAFDKGEVCFCVSLGASAKIVCAELSQKGYLAYDMGNASISYDCCLYKKDRKLIDMLNVKKDYILFL